jgi:hypothetical protein
MTAHPKPPLERLVLRLIHIQPCKRHLVTEFRIEPIHNGRKFLSRRSAIGVEETECRLIGDRIIDHRLTTRAHN